MVYQNKQKYPTRRFAQKTKDDTFRDLLCPSYKEKKSSIYRSAVFSDPNSVSSSLHVIDAAGVLPPSGNSGCLHSSIKHMTTVTTVPQDVLVYQLYVDLVAFTVLSAPQEARTRVTAYRK